jgi:general stress protein YciG
LQKAKQSQQAFVSPIVPPVGGSNKTEMERDMGEEKEKSEKEKERGFASMSEEERREIARKGGESVPDEKRSFSQDRDLASEAGRKGGASRRDRDR